MIEKKVMSPRIIFSPHALQRMRERVIDKELVKEAVLKPDKVEKSQFHPSRFLIKKIYFNERLQKDHLLLIISEIKQDLIEIVTIVDTSKISKYF
jgi:hypothetical protein